MYSLTTLVFSLRLDDVPHCTSGSPDIEHNAREDSRYTRHVFNTHFCRISFETGDCEHLYLAIGILRLLSYFPEFTSGGLEIWRSRVSIT